MNAPLKFLAALALASTLSGCVVTSSYVGYGTPYVRPYYVTPRPTYYVAPPVYVPPPVYVVPPRYDYGYGHGHRHWR